MKINLFYQQMACGLFALVLSLSVYSAESIQIKVEQAKRVGAFSVAVGSEVNLKSSDANSKLNGSFIFLGKAILPDTKNSFEIMLSKQEQKIYYVDASHFNEKDVKALQTILNPYEQAGGTCTGYAIFDFLYQTHLSGFKGSGALASKLADEKGRTNLLVDNINEYYLTPQHQYSIEGILNKYGKNFGFTCGTYTYKIYNNARERILDQLATGAPVMISFNLGPNMYNSPLLLELFDRPTETMDDRLWIPRKVGERNSGGHTIVATASFEHNDRTYLVVIDSDWSEPRVWDLDLFLNTKTAIKEVELTVCK